jgi:cyclophilin family peptidyl-prolyl cis-trans isomerase
MSLRMLVVAGAVVMTLGASQSAAQDNPTVVMETSLGNITIELFRDQAPIAVENFLQYANDGYYEGTVFHRVIQQFMTQGGGMTADLSPKRTRAPIKNEATNGVSNARGTLAMARTNVVDSATAQFFINTVNNARSLDNTGTDARSYGYAVFGRVTDGMDVVDRIAAVPTGSRGPHQDVPVEPVAITGVTVN